MKLDDIKETEEIFLRGGLDFISSIVKNYNFNIVPVMGPHYVGKGRAMDQLKLTYPQVRVITTGDIYRKPDNFGFSTDETEMIKHMVDYYVLQRGQLVPDKPATLVLAKAMLHLIQKEYLKENDTILCDSHPRTIPQIALTQNLATITGVWNFYASPEELEKRRLLRAKTASRSDDEMFAKRKKEYEKKTAPAIDELCILFPAGAREVDGNNIPEVVDQAVNILARLLYKIPYSNI